MCAGVSAVSLRRLEFFKSFQGNGSDWVCFWSVIMWSLENLSMWMSVLSKEVCICDHLWSAENICRFFLVGLVDSYMPPAARRESKWKCPCTSPHLKTVLWLSCKQMNVLKHRRVSTQNQLHAFTPDPESVWDWDFSGVIWCFC